MARRDKGFAQWFDQNSGYALHRPARRDFGKKSCCGAAPQPTGKRILFPHPEKGSLEPFDLYRCATCGAFYVQWGEGFCPVDNLLKYRLLPD